MIPAYLSDLHLDQVFAAYTSNVDACPEMNYIVDFARETGGIPLSFTPSMTL